MVPNPRSMAYPHALQERQAPRSGPVCQDGILETDRAPAQSYDQFTKQSEEIRGFDSSLFLLFRGGSHLDKARFPHFPTRELLLCEFLAHA